MQQKNGDTNAVLGWSQGGCLGAQPPTFAANKYDINFDKKKLVNSVLKMQTPSSAVVSVSFMGIQESICRK